MTIFGLSKRDVKIATVFTAVETVVLTTWIALLGNPVGAAVFLFIGLEVEHLISRLKG